MVSPAAIRRFTLSLDKSWGSRGSCLGKGQAELYVWVGGLFEIPPHPSGQPPLPVKDVADLGAGADGEQQCPGLQGSTEQAVQAGRNHRSCGAAQAIEPAENTF